MCGYVIHQLGEPSKGPFAGAPADLMETGEDGLPQLTDLFEETADDDKDIIDKRIKEHTKLRVHSDIATCMSLHNFSVPLSV